MDFHKKPCSFAFLRKMEVDKINKRPVDKSKKSNIKCEHCIWYMRPNSHEDMMCLNEASPKHRQPIKYWNRCKEFAWKTDIQELMKE